MKANELMIGDWVLYNETPQQILEISGIDDEVYLETDELVHQSEIQPIPLAPEILEKNGFIKGSYVGGFYSHWCPFRIYIEKRVEFSVLFDEEIFFTCTYIHQLQHALKLCGIDKTIEL